MRYGYMVAAIAVLALAAGGAEADPGSGPYVIPNFRYLNEVAPRALEAYEDTGEWIEIFNPHGYPFDISELGIYHNNTFDQKLEDYPYDPFVPGMVIPHHGFAIVMDMKMEGQYIEGETYDAVCNYINARSMQDKVIFLCTEDDAIGDGLHNRNDQLGVVGDAYLIRPDGDVPVAVASKVVWNLGTSMPDYKSWQFVGTWQKSSWTPGWYNQLNPLAKDTTVSSVLSK